MALLTVEHLNVMYHHRGEVVRAVEDVSFAVEAGEVFALVGESGSGKSSVALALTKLLPASASVSGCVRLGQQSLLESSEDDLRAIRGGKIAYVFQDPSTSLNPVLTIGAQLCEAIELHTEFRGDEARRRAVEWLRDVGLAMPQRQLEAYPHQLSGGMQQRVMLAMALAASPSLLVADEPTTALDVTIQVQILRLVRDLQRRLNLSVLLICHDLTVVERMAHRVGVMSEGRLVECGTVEQILRHPAHPSTQQLLRYRCAISLQGGHG
ncbi:MAG: ABC transporter ATP-binding protein [Candidatus Omnitrophica bacterium]|nr:ABC transporter ATP-binding protein [Candidatus Omnitrophota bacterium]